MPDSVKLRLGTRQSPLAMIQAQEARTRLCAAHGWAPESVELVPVRASGDKIQDRPLAEIGGKALWTKELDEWLAEGRIDGAVHSMKDVETIRPADIAIAAILPRADKRDVLLGASSVRAIKRGAIVGTSAPRRAAQMLHHRPDCTIVSIRGNVDTRIAKLAAGEADVTLLAAAGLSRLGKVDVGTPLDPDDWLPAPAQGAIGIECRAGDSLSRELLGAIDDAVSHAEIRAERALLAALGGTCHSPVAALTRSQDGHIAMTAALFSTNGAERVEGSANFAQDDADSPARLARDVLARSSAAIRNLFDGAA